MAKEAAVKDKDKKAAAPVEELVEKPREPMFSKGGMILLIGSNLLVIIVMIVVAQLFMKGGGEDKGSMPATTNGQQKAEDIEYFILEGCTANVAQPEGGVKKIRFKVNLRFAGDKGQRDQAVTLFSGGGRKEDLMRMAGEIVSRYDVNRVRESTFAATFENDFMNRFNARFVEQIASAGIWSID